MVLPYLIYISLYTLFFFSPAPGLFLVLLCKLKKSK
nr:MAG TPA: hypothetical protein [Caudoviricetes sp.]